MKPIETTRPAGRAFPLTVASLAALALVATLVSSLAAAPGLAQQADPTPGTVFTVEPRPVDDLKAVFGTVESIDSVPARARIGGTLRDLAVDEGSRVEAGQRIARIADEKLALELAALDSRIDAARSEVALARIERERIEALRSRGTVSEAAVDTARTNHAVATGNLAALRAERAAVAERQAEGAVLAPADGRVLAVEATDGQVVLPGEVVAMIAAEAYVLRLALPERHARFLEEGDTVLVGERGLAVEPEIRREGRVRQVYPELERGRVIADVDVEGLGDYFVGERTRVWVATGRRQAIVVPADYLECRYGITLARVESAGEVVVQTGFTRDDGVEVLSGLRPGDRLLPFERPAAREPCE